MTTTGNKPALVILDLDGVLVKRIHPANPKGKPDQQQIKDHGIRSITARNGSTIYFRNGILPFLEWLFNNYSVGIFTSITYGNAKELIDAILKKEQIEKLDFIWDRSRCQLHPDYGTNDNITDHDTCKVLSDVWKNASVNRDRHWNSSNVIMIDDSHHKMALNDPSNYIMMPSFDVYDLDTEPTDPFIEIKREIINRTEQIVLSGQLSNLKI